MTDKYIVNKAVREVLEKTKKEEEEEDKLLKQMSHGSVLAHIDGTIQYTENEENATLCDKMLLKKFQSQIKKRYFDPKKQSQQAATCKKMKIKNINDSNFIITLMM